VIDLLDVSRLERGGLILKLEQKDLAEVIDDCLNDFKLRHPNRDVTVKKTDGAIPKISIDTTRIYQVISNLLDNAAKFTPDDSLLEIILESLHGQVQFSLIDHGPGITEEQQAVMFTPFTRGSTELTKRSGGLGLGLYICREIIRLHGGEIGVKSELGKGTTFYFRLATTR
jgi:signal transduction histidine kinase